MATARTHSLARPLFLFNAAVAAAAVGLSFTLMAIGYYRDQIDPTKPTLLGNIPTGKDQFSERFFDWISYFTILSNLLVLVVMVMLLLNPDMFQRRDRAGRFWRALRLDSLLMITVTGIVYNLLLNSGSHTGVDLYSNALQHIVNPIVTIGVWLVVGPRDLIGTNTVFHSLLLPTLWAAAVLTRGSFIDAYPYFFLDIASNGLVSVLLFILQILIFAVVLALLMRGYESLRSRRRGFSVPVEK